MEEPKEFIWYGEGGEPLRFADLSEAEQRVALIAAGALLRGGKRRETEVGLSEIDTERSLAEK